MPDEKANQCTRCAKKFTALHRRHHCRADGLIYCGDCTRKVIVPGYKKLQRACVECAAQVPAALDVSVAVSADLDASSDDDESSE